MNDIDKLITTLKSIPDETLRLLNEPIMIPIMVDGITEDWYLKDIPWTTRENMNKILNIFHHQNFKVLAISTKGDSIRGQVAVNEEGMSNLTNYVERLS